MIISFLSIFSFFKGGVGVGCKKLPIALLISNFLFFQKIIPFFLDSFKKKH